jgi:hypothetical protein
MRKILGYEKPASFADLGWPGFFGQLHRPARFLITLPGFACNGWGALLRLLNPMARFLPSALHFFGYEI